MKIHRCDDASLDISKWYVFDKVNLTPLWVTDKDIPPECEDMFRNRGSAEISEHIFTRGWDILVCHSLVVLDLFSHLVSNLERNPDSLVYTVHLIGKKSGWIYVMQIDPITDFTEQKKSPTNSQVQPACTWFYFYYFICLW